MISFGKKRFGMRIGPYGISAVEIKGNRRPEIAGSWRKDLSVDFSPASLKGAVAAALSAAGFRSGNISFSIPDGLARVAIVDFTELPKKHDDANEIVKAKAAKMQGVEGNAYAHDFQALPASAGKRVVSVMVKRDIVEALEEAAEKAGLSVMSIGIDSFNLANLLPREDEDAAIFLRQPDSLVIAISRAGSLDFYRCKGICQDANGILRREIASTLAYYLGSNPGLRVRKAYVLCEGGIDSEIEGVLPSGTDIAGIGELVPEGQRADKMDIGILAALGCCI